MSETRILNVAKRWHKARAEYLAANAARLRDGGLEWHAACDHTRSAWQAAESDLAAAIAEDEKQHSRGGVA